MFGGALRPGETTLFSFEYTYPSFSRNSSQSLERKMILGLWSSTSASLRKVKGDTGSVVEDVLERPEHRRIMDQPKSIETAIKRKLSDAHWAIG